jgi:hypothetical protein
MDIEEGFSPIERAATMSIACETVRLSAPQNALVETRSRAAQTPPLPPNNGKKTDPEKRPVIHEIFTAFTRQKNAQPGRQQKNRQNVRLFSTV